MKIPGRDSYATVDSETAKDLSAPSDHRTVEVFPPSDTELPATVERFMRAVTEYQTKLVGIRNTSPTIAYEFQRFQPERLRLQFAVPNARLERKLRTHLQEQIPDIWVEEGVNEIPVREGDTAGVGVLSLRRKEVYPLRTEFETPPTNSVVTSLHQDAMPGNRVLVQLLFKPITGRPIQRRLWQRKADRESRNLRSRKVGFLPWNDRDATPIERSQANQVDSKAGSPRFNVSIRILVIGAGKYTPDRVKEISGGFNIFANIKTGQGFQTKTLRSLRDKKILNLITKIKQRRLGQHFQLSTNELAGLTSIPDREQKNIEKSV